ncbi:ATP-binding cassette domain-containing protein [Undibacterium sp. CY18W]|uniref:ATP-binding cassette domain-containing protein n=1 Tax=Undibacterium hunanense TaxID=2762292 RepID=A0ABR6ZMD0_9BURK|nr:ATP-binding cassette domain-containing protein [Undibacterium hunanense]MBC3916959.1 ATP-binding cassette domain-containing protein [Undibacterium hunanense]
MTKNTILLQATELSFAYPGQALFNNWSGEITPGVTLIYGGDGRGKTSLLQLLAGVLPVQKGQLQIQGAYLHTEPDVYRNQIFWVDPATEDFDQMTVMEYFTSLHKQYPLFDETLLENVIEGLGLTPHVDKKLFMLSTGSKRKVWLAAAFAAGATINLLDDPFAALDKTSINFVVKMLTQFAQHSAQAWVITMYQVPQGVPLAGLIDLGD